MPHKPAKPCASHGCPKLTTARYCEEHAKQEARRYNQHQRDPKTNKRYGWAWKRIRAAFINAHPTCELCNREGKLIPATTVHHKKKVADGGSNDFSNLMSLCDSCHSSLHARQGDYF